MSALVNVLVAFVLSSLVALGGASGVADCQAPAPQATPAATASTEPTMAMGEGESTTPAFEPAVEAVDVTPISAADTPPLPEAVNVPSTIRAAARFYGLDADRLLRIAWCESRWGTHPNTNAPSNPNHGVFQFSADTWAWASVEAGFAGAAREDAEPNIWTAAYVMAGAPPKYGFHHWSCR